jgi:hypothetical protein
VALNPKKGEVYAVGGNGFQAFLVPEFFKLLKPPTTATEGRR